MFSPARTRTDNTSAHSQTRYQLSHHGSPGGSHNPRSSIVGKDQPRHEKAIPMGPQIEDVIKLINKINVHKSSGLPNIRSNVQKDVFMSLADKITRIFNASLEKEIFPEEWKKGYVVPPPKKPLATEATDLRPASLLPVPGKCWKGIFVMLKYLETNKLLSETQHGFRAGNSTVSAMTDLLNRIRQCQQFN